MIILFILLCIIVICSIAYFLATDTPNNEKRGRKMTSKCEKCAQTFTWFEDDALVKYGYGDKYILHCPHCDKLTKVTKIL